MTISRIAVVLCVGSLLWGVSAKCFGGEHSEGTVSGFVSVAASGGLLRLSGARLNFTETDGRRFQATTDKLGEYTVVLNDGTYDVSVEVRGMCTIHRPPFFLKRKASVRFNFKMVVCPFVDYVTVPSTPTNGAISDTSGSPGSMYYREDRVAFGADSTKYLIIAYGMSEKEQGRVRYEHYRSPFSDAPGDLPIFISFGTYTVEAAKAESDEGTRTLHARGDVSISDGSGSPPATLACVSLSLQDSPPKISPCK